MAFVFEDDEKQAAASTAGGGGGRYVFEDDEPAGPVIRQGKDPSLIDRVFDLFENPDKERAKAVQALVDAEVFNIRPSDAMRYRDAIDSGVKLNKNAIAASRRTTILERVEQSWQTGVNQVVMGSYGADVVLNNDPKALEKMLEAQSKMPTEDTEYIPESKLEYAFRSAAKMSPMMFQIMKESVKKGLPVSMAAGGAVALLNMGPQGVSAPVTVPAAAAIGFKAGATGAAFTEAMKLEAGLAFAEFAAMEDADGNKMDINIARAAAFGVGAVNAGLEVAQVKMLLKTIPGSEKILKNAIMEAVASKVLKERLAGVAAMYAGTVAKETAVELAQESTNIVMEHVAANVNNALKGTDIKASDMAAVLDRLFETGKESAAAFSIMALPGSLARALPTGKRESTPDAAGSPSLTGQDTIKAEASPADKTSQGPFILGVNEDAAGEVKSFTMADPTTGATYEVPALKAEDKDTVRYVPDMSALDTQADIDTQIDRIIEGQEDIDQISAKIFQDDIQEMGFVEEVFTEDDAKPETVLDRVKAINDRIGEKGSVDLEPLVELGRSIFAEGHQTLEAFTTRAKELLSDVWDKVKYHIQAAWSILNNERGSVSMEPMTTPKGTANITAKDHPTPEAEIDVISNALKKRYIKGDALLDAEDLAQDLLEKGGRIDSSGIVTLYHRTTPENANQIVKNQQMVGKEDRLFFGTHPDGQIDGYGDAIVEVKLPLEKLELNDIFTNEAHVTLKSGRPGSKIRISAKLFEPAKTTPQADAVEPNFKTGVPVTFDYIHNTQKSPNMGSRFGQDKEPAGMYIQTKPRTFTPQDNLEVGTVTFNNPLVIEFGGGYGEPTNWKNVLSEKYNGKTGKGLSRAIQKDGYDGVVTISKYGPSEIVILPNPSRPPEVGGHTLYSGVDPTQIIPVLKSLTENLKEAWPHLEALGLKAYESGKATYSAWSAEMKSYLGDLWESFKGAMSQIWESVKAINKQIGERGSFSTKKVSTDDINIMLSAASRQDEATGGNLTPESYVDLQTQAAQEAFAVIEKKMTRAQKREAAMLARQGEADARLMPTYSAMSHIVNAGGMSLKSLQADYDGNTIRELMNKRPGLVSKKGTMGPDVFADQHGFESGDDMINAILDWRGLKAEGKEQAKEFFKYYEKVIATDDMAAMREDFERAEQKALNRLTKKYKPKAAKGIKKEIRRRTGQVQPGDRMVTEYDALTEAFRKEANTARRAFAEGKKEEVERSKEVMRWLVKRRESMKNVRDYFGLTDAEMMSATNRRNPALMDDAEFKQFLRNVELKAVELAETRQEKMALLKLIEDKRLKKVDNYRRALELPTFNDMTAQQLRDFAKLLEPFQDDDIFLTQRELETVDRTDLKGIKTWREARERLAKEAGVPVEELNKVHVEALDSFRWDTALRERDAFFGILVEQMTQSYVGAQLRAHEIENRTYELARKSEKSRDRGIIDRLIPQDDLIMAYLEAPMDQKAAIVEQMTPEQIDFANYMQQYFAGALEYLMATKSLERGRENYFVHIRKTFLENLKDGGLKKAVSEIFKTYQQDQMVFNILDDDTGKILPLEKFFQFSLQRTDTMDPTRNVTKAFLTYVNTFEKKKMFDAIIPKLDIYAQALTPTRYTPRGLEIDRSLKTFVNKWINNKKGRRISFDSTLRQGGPLDVGIRALRAFTTILDLGLSPIVQTAAFIGEQVANAAMLGNKAMAIGTARMRTAQGKAILKKYESWVGRSLWEEFTAPGKEVTERLSQMLFAGFHLSSVTANKQFLLASLTEQEWQSGEISTERLAEMRLDMGRFRVVPGTGSLVGSTSAGDAAMQYKKWAVPIARTLIADAETLIGNIKAGQPLDARAGKELMRFAYMSAAVFIVGAMAGADDDDRSVIGKAKGRLYREAMTLMQGIDPTLWLATPRTLTWLYQTAQAFKSMVLMETYKSGDKEGELKGDDKLKRQFVPGVVRSVASED
jgi:hypothetical protein